MVFYLRGGYMDTIKLLLADPDPRFAELVSRFIIRYPDIEFLGNKENGNDAYSIIRTVHPDAVIFDLVLPGLDGLSLLSKVRTLPNPPTMICCSRFVSDVSLEAMRKFDADYLLYKPVELQSIHPAVRSCTELHRKMRRTNRALLEDFEAETHAAASIRNYLVTLGVPARLIGCAYLAEAIRLARNDISLIRNLSKGLYLEIARSMHTTPTRIERSIRNAISVAYHTGGLDANMRTCPSNKEFINYIIRNMDI